MSSDSGDQLARGKEMFRIRCEPCYGDVGQGLALWRSTWALEDQNCSQTKCHALNHPPDGFYMPEDAPPIIGAGTLKRFATARELYGFISKAMPFDKPGELSSDDYWAVTAFLLQQNVKLPEGIQLKPTNAASVVINLNASTRSEGTPTPAAVAQFTLDPTPLAIVAILGIGIVAVWFWVRRGRWG